MPHSRPDRCCDPSPRFPDRPYTPDAEEYIQQRLFQERIEAKVAEIRKQPKNHPLRKELLKTELLPYQLDGIAFAAGAGRVLWLFGFSLAHGFQPKVSFSLSKKLFW